MVLCNRTGMDRSASVVERLVRGDCMGRQMPAVIRNDSMKFVTAMEDVFAMVTMGVEASMTRAVRTDHPDIRVAAEEHHVPVDNIRDVDVVGHRLIPLFDNHRLRWWRWAQGARQYFVHLVRIDYELALLVGRTSREKRRTSDRRERNS
jgi:hypothetical protein